MRYPLVSSGWGLLPTMRGEEVIKVSNTKRLRVQVTLSPAMRLSLEVLAERTGLPISAQAMVVLRQGLDRTIQAEEGPRRLAAQNAVRNHAVWVEDPTTDRAVELEYRAAMEQGES